MSSAVVVRGVTLLRKCKKTFTKKGEKKREREVSPLEDHVKQSRSKAMVQNKQAA